MCFRGIFLIIFFIYILLDTHTFMVYRELDTKATYLILLKKRVTFLFVRDRDMSKQRLPIGRYSNGKAFEENILF